MKLQQDMRKKRQEMLEKQIECQKVRQTFIISLLEFMYRVDFPKIFPPKFSRLFVLEFTKHSFTFFVVYFIDVNIQARKKQKHETRRESKYNEDFERAWRKDLTIER